MKRRIVLRLGLDLGLLDLDLSLDPDLPLLPGPGVDNRPTLPNSKL